MLKLDPTNTELVAQKQEILNQRLKATTEELELLKQHQKDVSESGQKLTEEQQKKYRALQREIIKLTEELKTSQTQASKWTKAGQAIEEYGTKIQNLGNKIDSVGNKLTTRLTLPLVALGVAGVQSAASQEAAMQQVELIYGDASDAIKNFAENTAIAYNISTSDAYKYAQIYGNLIQSITDDEEENALYTQQLLKASSVIASATGRTMEDVMDRIRSGLLGNTEAIEDLGVNVNVSLLESTDAFRKFAGDKSWEQLDFQTQQQIRLFGILEQTTKKYGEEVNKNTSSDIQRLTAKFKNLTSNLSKKLLPIADKLIDKAEDFLGSLEDLDDEQIDNIINIGLMVAAAGPLVKILGTVISTVGGAAKGIGIFSQAIAVATNKTTSNVTSVNNLAKAFEAIASPMGIFSTLLIGSVGIGIALSEEQDAYAVAIENSKKQLEDATEAQQEFRKEQDEILNSSLTEADNIQKLSDELKGLVDANGKVKEGYEGRVNFILNELNEALGTEYKLNGNIIESYDEIADSIDTVIQKKRAQAVLENEEAKYNEAMDKRTEAYNDMIAKEEELAKAKEKVAEAEENLANADDRFLATSKETYKQQLNFAKGFQKQAEDNLNSSKAIYKTYLEDIANYENDYEIVLSGNTEKINDLINSRTYTYQQNSEDIGEAINHNIQQVQYELEQYKLAREEDLKHQDKVNAEKNQKQIEASETQLETLTQQLLDMTSTTEELTPQQIEAWKNLATGSYDIYRKTIDKMPKEMRDKIEQITQIVSNDTNVIDAIKELAKNSEDAFDNNVNAQESGENFVQGIEKGVNNKSSNLISRIATLGKNMVKSLNQSLDEHSPSKISEESGENFVQGTINGLKSKEKEVLNLINKLGSNLVNKFNKSFNEVSLNTGFANAKLNSRVIDSTRTIFTTPTLNIYTQGEVNIRKIADEVNRIFGSQY